MSDSVTSEANGIGKREGVEEVKAKWMMMLRGTRGNGSRPWTAVL